MTRRRVVAVVSVWISVWAILVMVRTCDMEVPAVGIIIMIVRDMTIVMQRIHMMVSAIKMVRMDIGRVPQTEMESPCGEVRAAEIDRIPVVRKRSPDESIIIMHRRRIGRRVD